MQKNVKAMCTPPELAYHRWWLGSQRMGTKFVSRERTRTTLLRSMTCLLRTQKEDFFFSRAVCGGESVQFFPSFSSVVVRSTPSPTSPSSPPSHLRCVSEWKLGEGKKEKKSTIKYDRFKRHPRRGLQLNYPRKVMGLHFKQKYSFLEGVGAEIHTAKAK